MNLLGAVVGIALTITTQNVRVGLPPPEAHHDINQAAAHSSIVFTQEMALRDVQRFAPSGWGSAHFSGLRRGDCATYWNRSVWTRVNAWTVPLTWAGFRAGHRFALVTILRGHGLTLAVVCVHSITHSTRPARRPVFARGMARLNVVLQRLRTKYPVVVGGDWNRGWTQRARFTGFRSVETHGTTSGGGGHIDYFEWSPRVRFGSQRVIGHTFSDHNGVRLHLRLR